MFMKSVLACNVYSTYDDFLLVGRQGMHDCHRWKVINKERVMEHVGLANIS